MNEEESIVLNFTQPKTIPINDKSIRGTSWWETIARLTKRALGRFVPSAATLGEKTPVRYVLKATQSNYLRENGNVFQ